jgi:hypothetical protein
MLRTMETSKIRIKIGDSEFEAEGPEDLVRVQFDEFMSVMKAHPPSPAPPLLPQALPDPTAALAVAIPAPEVSPDWLSRVFQVRNRTVTLLALPKSETAIKDAMLMLIYGFEKLLGTGAVTGVALAEAARQSGVQIDRVDRVMKGLGAWINAGGARRGRRYSLNNPGRKKAEDLIIGLA